MQNMKIKKGFYFISVLNSEISKYVYPISIVPRECLVFVQSLFFVRVFARSQVRLNICHFFATNTQMLDRKNYTLSTKIPV